MTTKTFQSRLVRRLRKAGASAAPSVCQALEQYFQLLALWNAKINLTGYSLSEPNEESIDRLLVEPLVAARHMDPGTKSIIDIGSGSGSPAIPLLLATGPRRLVLVEAKTRKSVFLMEALRHLRHLHLTDAIVETARFEQLLTRPELHEAFDLLTIRAVRVEARTLMTLQAFVRPGGQIFWFRGPAGTDVPNDLIVPLTRTAVHPLVENLQSRLVVLTKQSARPGLVQPRRSTSRQLDG
jgi:16S rRNA (guanine527-N7)-methyltransferase